MMKKHELKIELLSDLCVADGGVYNSMLDADVCHDIYGLPYIPGKRIKGCLRECALELQDWGEYIPINRIFGMGGDKENGSLIRIGDARLVGSESLIEEILSGDSIIYHPQNVLGQYTYIRTQTSVDPETGVAKEKSLRTMRVVKKGCVFISEVECDDSVSYALMANICKCLRNMGLGRTRGLGEVKCDFSPVINAESNMNVLPSDRKREYHGEPLLKYEIELKEPMICKSINGGESNSVDYIEGSKIIGLLANELNSDEKLTGYLDSGVKFSNAYIVSKGVRASAAGAYLYKIKNDDKNYINRLYFEEKEDEQRQFNAIRNAYVLLSEDGGLKQVTVRKEERYHHSRPSDKSIGRADNSDESKFYQISSISPGQAFAGYISGSRQQLEEIFTELSDVTTCYMGYGRGSEYGKCKFMICGDDAQSNQRRSIKAKQIVVMLNAPAIVYSANAMYSVDKQDLLKEVLAALGLACDISVKADFYINYANIGGYNVTWKARKPVIMAFDKGTAIKLQFREEQDITIDSYMYLGERTAEGYGEFVCEELKDNQSEEQWKYVDDITSDETTDREKPKTSIGELGKNIYLSLLNNFIRERAGELVKKCGFNTESYRPTVSNLILICNEQESLQKIEEVVNERFGKNSANKKDKSQKARKIIEAVMKSYGSIERDFAKQLDLADASFADEEELKKAYLKQVLQESKYQIRKIADDSIKRGGAGNE